jgi:ABC-type nitrate/sulfonate/bicarbonate transport system substrate-binding protein
MFMNLRAPAHCLISKQPAPPQGPLAVKYLRSTVAAALLLPAIFLTNSASAADETLVRVNTFPTARSLPFYVGVDKGMFARHGIKLELEFTENSKSQREGLASGKFEVVQAAVDNAIAMIEVAKLDVVIVSGGDSGTNEFIVGKGIESFDGVRGKKLVVDAPNTAYALQGIKILAQHGLKLDADYKLNPVGNGPHRLKAMLDGGDNAAAIMNLPFSAETIEAGMKSLGRTTDMLGPYQAGGAFVMRQWAKDHADVLERYLAGYIESLRWVMDKKNRDEAIALLMEKRKLSRSLATRSYDLMIEPGFGFNPDAKLSDEGFNNVLKLRQEIEGGPPPQPAKYLDLTYYDRAVKMLAR